VQKALTAALAKLNQTQSAAPSTASRLRDGLKRFAQSAVHHQHANPISLADVLTSSPAQWLQRDVRADGYCAKELGDLLAAVAGVQDLPASATPEQVADNLTEPGNPVN
jgi:hypothetical protein